MTDNEAESAAWVELMTIDWLKENTHAELIFHAGFRAGLQHARRSPLEKDWTVGADGRFNSSDEFERLVGVVEQLLRDHHLGDSVRMRAGLIIAQLTHEHGLVPKNDPRPKCIGCGQRWTPREGVDATAVECDVCERNGRQ